MENARKMEAGAQALVRAGFGALLEGITAGDT